MIMMKYFAFLLLIALGLQIETATAENLGSGPYDDNCVLFIRNVKHVTFPGNLFSWDDKKRIKNSDKPKKGSIALIDVGNKVGHVALVEKVDSKGDKQSITIVEANFPHRGYWRRTAKGKSINSIEKELKIYGYFRP